MKNLPTFNEFLNEQEEVLNEDGSSIATSLMLLMQSTATLAMVMAKSGAFDGGSDWSIKSWWEEWKRDRKVNKILDKLKDDPEVIAFLKLPEREQKGKWQKLIEPKLDKDEKEYLKSISRDRAKRGKI